MNKLTKLPMRIVLLCNLAVVVSGAFEEVPKTQEVSNGVRAVFRCRHGSADTIRWRVDHTLISANPPADITPNTVREGDHVVHTLTIVGCPQYNGTIVECVAMFDDHSPDEQTAPALLLVREFTKVPSSLNLTYGEKGMFVCRHESADHISWKVTPGWLYNQFEPTTIGGDYILSVYLTEGIHYNATTIQCQALFDDSPTQSTDSEPATLLVQEPMDPVGDLSENKTTSTLFWTPPPSLDLTNADPDIAYCVDVYNITCGMRDHIISDCSVMEPSYTRNVSGDGYLYEHVVTPRSNVPEASNGTSQSLKDEYPVLNSSGLANLRDFRDSLAISVDSALNQSRPSSYTMFLESIDLQSGHSIQMNITAETDSSTIYFNLSSIPPTRLFTCKIRTYGCADISSLLADFVLSTHNAQNITVVAIGDGIQIEGHYIDNTEAEGLLVIMYKVPDPVPQYCLIPKRKSGPKRRKFRYGLAGVGAGEWLISVFVVEKDSLPSSRVATLPKVVFIPKLSSEIQPQPPASIELEYSVQPTPDCVRVTCYFKQDTSVTGCLVVVHQHLSLINLTRGLMGIEANWTQRFTRHGDEASGCIHGMDLELHQIGVANGRNVPAPKVVTALVITILSIMGVVLPLGIALLSIFVIIVLRNRTRRRVGGHQVLSKKLTTPMEQTANRDRYVTLPPVTRSPEESSTKQVDQDTYKSNGFEESPSAVCEDGDNSTDETSGMKEEATSPVCQTLESKDGGNSTDGTSGMKEEATTRVCQTLDQAECQHSSGTVSQELNPSDPEYDVGRDGVSSFSGEPVEVMDQPVKTVDDLDPAMASVVPEKERLIPAAVKSFLELRDEPYLPQSKERPCVAREVLQPVTAPPLPYNKGGDEIVLLGRRHTSSLELAETKSKIGKRGSDADANELVTGHRCW